MVNVSIRLAKDEDITSVYALCKKEQWNFSEKAISRLLGYEPNGCFVAEVDGIFAGQVFSVSFGEVGWIGLMIVDERLRRKGIATLLMKKAIAYLLGSGAKTIKLEAVPAIMDLYRKLGFVEEFDSLRFVGTSGKRIVTDTSGVDPFKDEDVEEVAAFDSVYFGASRLGVLKELRRDHPETCFLSSISSNIVGYIIAYEVEKGYRIGPWVCDPTRPEIARRLFAKCIDAVEPNTPLYAGVPVMNEAAKSILSDMGFKLVTKSIRMYLGRKTAIPHGIFSISGPENG